MVFGVCNGGNSSIYSFWTRRLSLDCPDVSPFGWLKPLWYWRIRHYLAMELSIVSNTTPFSLAA